MKTLFLRTWLLCLLSVAAFAQPARVAPRLQGNYAKLTPQLAYNTMLMGRLPKVGTLPTNRFLFWQGPVLASPSERRKLFSRAGVTHLMIPDVTNAMKLPAEQRGNFPGGHGIHVLAGHIADRLPDSDPRKASLRAYATPPYFVDHNAEAYRLLGYESYVSSVNANQGVPPSVWGMDLEDHQPKPGYPEAELLFITHVYEGAKKAIADRNAKTLVYTYGVASLGDIVNHTKNRQDADIYFREPGNFWRGGSGSFDPTNPKVLPFLENAIVGGDKYLRRTWDKESLFERNPDGSIRCDGRGLPVYRTGKRTISNYGQICDTYTHEAEAYADMFYSEADNILTAWRWKCNTPPTGYAGDFKNMPFPRGTVDLRPALRRLRLLGYLRNNTEIEQFWNPAISNFDPFYSTPELGIEAANQRPLSPESIEFTMLLRTMLYDAVYVWSAEGNYADWINGRANQHKFENGFSPRYTFGQFETLAWASRRGRQFPGLFEVMDSEKAVFLLPWRFVVRGNTTNREESQASKPVYWGIKEQGGNRIWEFWCLPTQDVGNASHDRYLKRWIEMPDGRKSRARIMLCKDRQTGFDESVLEPGFENATAEDFRYEFVSLLGDTYYRTGNYNVPVTAKPTVPTSLKPGSFGMAD